jgi:hypothetical protein
LAELEFSSTLRSTQAVSTLLTLRTTVEALSPLESTTSSSLEKARSQSFPSYPAEESDYLSTKKEISNSDTKLQLNEIYQA